MNIPFKILYEDNHLIVVIKPFCIPSQGDETGDISLLDLIKNYIKSNENKKGDAFVALIHRLDRPVGGIMVFGKSSKAAARLSAQFHNREVQKKYFAITESIPLENENRLTHTIKQLPGKNIVKTYKEGTPGAKIAILDFKIIAQKNSRALLEILPLTGRRHQIRVQLSAIKCPIMGDVKYGKTNFLPDQSIALFAGELSFKHPVKNEILYFKEDLPNYFPWNQF